MMRSDTREDEEPLDIVLVSTADWDNPYWTNKQHVAVQLGQRGHRILYIESQGLRRPTASKSDLVRIWRRLKRALRLPRRVRDNIWVVSPIAIPAQSSRFVRSLNRFILKSSLALWSSYIGLKPKILWTYSPMTTELFEVEPYDLLVYHAVDDIAAQPGMPREAILAAEQDLSARADLIFTTAPNLYDVHRVRNVHTHYFSNVADYAHFNKAMDPKTEIPLDIADISSPRIGFIGAISGYKLDFALLRAGADARPDWSLVLIGEVGEGDPWTDVSILKNARNVHLLGGRPYALLPGYLKAIDVAILPNRPNEYTKSMFPMKFFEYLAAGRHVVGTELPALSSYGHVAAFANDAAGFIAAIDSALRAGCSDLETRLEVAREHTYEIRTGRMMDIVMQRLSQKHPDSNGEAP